MRSYLITIALATRQSQQHQGLYLNDWQAIDAALDMFGLAHRLTVRRISP